MRTGRLRPTKNGVDPYRTGSNGDVRAHTDQVRAIKRLVPPAYPTMADMPPPGPARRRILRAAGINLRMSDFSEGERAERWLSRAEQSRRNQKK